MSGCDTKLTSQSDRAKSAFAVHSINSGLMHRGKLLYSITPSASAEQRQHGPVCRYKARTPSVIRSWKFVGPTIASIPASRISSRTTSRTRAKARVTPWLCSFLIRLNSSSLALMSMKLTGPKSRSTRLTSGRAASDAFNASLTWPTLAKKRSPPIRQINNPGKAIASGWTLNVPIGLSIGKLAERCSMRMAGSIDQNQQR